MLFFWIYDGFGLISFIKFEICIDFFSPSKQICPFISNFALKILEYFSFGK